MGTVRSDDLDFGASSLATLWVAVETWETVRVFLSVSTSCQRRPQSSEQRRPASRRMTIYKP